MQEREYGRCLNCRKIRDEGLETIFLLTRDEINNDVVWPDT